MCIRDRLKRAHWRFSVFGPSVPLLRYVTALVFSAAVGVRESVPSQRASTMSSGFVVALSVRATSELALDCRIRGRIVLASFMRARACSADVSEERGFVSRLPRKNVFRNAL